MLLWRFFGVVAAAFARRSVVYGRQRELPDFVSSFLHQPKIDTDADDDEPQKCWKELFSSMTLWEIRELHVPRTHVKRASSGLNQSYEYVPRMVITTTVGRSRRRIKRVSLRLTRYAMKRNGPRYAKECGTLPQVSGFLYR